MAIARPETYLAELNEPQREAVLATEGPLLVVAGAGSGKTRVLTYRVAHLIEACGVKPQEILAITFTNKAATEMRERLERILGRTARAIWILTFHAACGRILRREAERLGYKSSFTIYDQADQIRLVKQCLEALDKDPKRFPPGGIHARIASMPILARTIPMAAADTDSSSPSTSRPRTRCHRLAPSAARTPISRVRAVLRASIRLATLAQAMRSTSDTAPSSISSHGRTRPTRW